MPRVAEIIIISICTTPKYNRGAFKHRLTFRCDGKLWYNNCRNWKERNKKKTWNDKYHNKLSLVCKGVKLMRIKSIYIQHSTLMLMAKRPSLSIDQAVLHTQHDKHLIVCDMTNIACWKNCINTCPRPTHHTHHNLTSLPLLLHSHC